MHNANNHIAVKAFLSFLIVAIGAMMFFIFYNNQETILSSNWQQFITLAVVGAALLVGLLYLVSNSQHEAPKKVKRTTSKKRK